MIKINKITLVFVLLFCFLKNFSHAMDQPLGELSNIDMNGKIFEALEILSQTAVLTSREQAELGVLINNVKYSTNMLMSEEDFERFVKNYKLIKRRCGHVQAWYLGHLQAYLDDEDIFRIRVQTTFFEKLQPLESFAKFVSKAYILLTVALIQYVFYERLQQSWAREETGSKTIADWLELHALFLMILSPMDGPMFMVGKWGLLTYGLRRLSFEQLKEFGEYWGWSPLGS